MTINDFEHLLSRSKYNLHHDFVRCNINIALGRHEVASAKDYTNEEILFYSFLQDFKSCPEKALNIELIKALNDCKCEKNPKEYVKWILECFLSKGTPEQYKEE